MLEEKKYFVFRLSPAHRFRILKTQPATGEGYGPFTWGEAGTELERLNSYAIKPRTRKVYHDFETDQERRLYAFLAGLGKALNRSGLEDEVKLPFRSVRDWMNRKGTLAQDHLDALEAWAKSINYE